MGRRKRVRVRGRITESPRESTTMPLRRVRMATQAVVLAVAALTAAVCYADADEPITTTSRRLLGSKRQRFLDKQAAAVLMKMRHRNETRGTGPDVAAAFFGPTEPVADGSCTVENTNPSGDGSLFDCIEQADFAPGGTTFDISFSQQLKGETIPVLLNPEGTKCLEYSVNNPDGGFAPSLKLVRIIGPPRFLKLGDLITIDATAPACADIFYSVFRMGADVSLEMANLRVVGGGTGLSVFGIGEGDFPRAPSVSLTNLVFEDQLDFGINLVDVAPVTVNKVEVTNAGNDAFSYVLEFGVGTEVDLIEASISYCRFSNSLFGMFIRLDTGGFLDPVAGRVTVVHTELIDNGHRPVEEPFGVGFTVLGIEPPGNSTEFDPDLEYLVSVTLYDVTATGNADAGVFIISAGVKIRRSNLSNNGLDRNIPDPFFDQGLGLASATLLQLSRSRIVGNKGFGIALVVGGFVRPGIIATYPFKRTVIRNNRFGAIGTVEDTF